MPSIIVSSDSPLAEGVHPSGTVTQEAFVMALRAAAAVSISTRSFVWRHLSNSGHHARWLASRPSTAIPPEPAAQLAAHQSAVGIPSAPASPRKSGTERIELAIDSLHNYELLKPIPVLIESLGGKVFLAEAPDLDLSTTGNSVGAAFLLLKEHILTSYEAYRSKKGADAERALFEKYIGKPKRHWF